MNCFNPPRRGSWGSRLSPPAVAAIAAIIALLALAPACSDSEPFDNPATDAPSVISHSARVDADNGQIVFVSVVLSAPARAAVEYENEYAGKFRTALSETAAAEHLIPVVTCARTRLISTPSAWRAAAARWFTKRAGSSRRAASPDLSPRC